jgi:phage baseplate assembly protein W
MDYLALPLVLKDGALPRTDLKESIIHSVGIILATRKGMLPFAPDFGCDMWHREFSDMTTARKGDISAEVRMAISKHERRLRDVEVRFSDSGGSTSFHIGLSITVSGKYTEGDEERLLECSYDV